MSNHRRVFISYARDDGANIARMLRARLEHEEPEITLWQDRTDLEGGIGWWRQITEALDAVEFMILVLTPAAVRSPVVRKEWRYARQQGVCVYPVKGVPDAELDYAALPRWMRKAHFYDLDSEWPNFIAHLRAPCRGVRVPFMAPDFPDGFVTRPKEYEQLLTFLLGADRRDPVANTTALHGAGGFGKTTLAAALCHEEAIVEAFDDGILWVTLGERPNVQDGLTKLFAALTGERPAFRDVEDAAGHLAAKLEDKNCLLVIDDVWSKGHLKPFLRGGRDCARLITTRQFEIAASIKRVAVDQMTTDEAMRMLTTRLESQPADLAQFSALARRLGYWPLLLEFVGGALQLRLARGDTLDGALDYVNRGLNKKGAAAFSRADAAERHQSIARTIEVSIDLLDPEQRKHYIELAIFPEDHDVPLATVEALWGLETFETEDLVQRLGDLSLLKFDLKTGSVRLHDVVRAYLAGQLSEAAALHRRLIDAWGDLRRLPDAYAWHQLAYHLVRAGRQETLHELLLDLDWLQAALDATDPYTLQASYVDVTGDFELSLIQGAIRLSAHILARDKSQLRGQLHGRLLGLGPSAIPKLLRPGQPSGHAPWLRPVRPCLTPPGGALLRTIEGHSDQVRALALTADGRRAVSAGIDRMLKLWDLEGGVELRQLIGHKGRISALAVTPDGRHAVSYSSDGTLRLWDLGTGTELNAFEGGVGQVRALVIASDARRATSVSEDGTVALWDLQSGMAAEISWGKLGWVRVATITLTPDGRRIIAGTEQGNLLVWDRDGEAGPRRLGGHSGGITAVAMTPDGRHGLTAATDRIIRVWDLERGRTVRVIDSSADRIRALAIMPDGRRAVSSTSYGPLRVWDLEGTSPPKVLDGYAGAVTALAVTLDGRRVVSTAEDGTLRVWDWNARPAHFPLESHAGSVITVAVTDQGRRAVSVGEDGTLKVWDLAETDSPRTFAGFAGVILAAAISADGRHAFCSMAHGTLDLWDMDVGTITRTLSGFGDLIRALAVTPDGRRLVAAVEDGRIWIWDSDRALLRVLKSAGERITAVAVTPDGRCAVSGAENGQIGVWDLEKEICLHKCRAHRTRIAAVAVYEDGRRAVTASDDRTVAHWDLEEMLGLCRLEGHGNRVLGVAVTSDGRYAVSASADRSLRVWDLARGCGLASFVGDATFQVCGITRDGHTIIGGDAAGRIHFLRLEPNCSDDRGTPSAGEPRERTS
jgi:WD40 repeat protein